MALHYVDADTKAHRGDLEGDLTETVKAYFAEHRTMSEDKAGEALVVFDRMKELNLRLACDCRPGDRELPLLSAAEPAQLRRMKAPPNPAHAPTCRFALRNLEADSVITPTRTRRDDGDLAIHGEFSVPGEGMGAGGGLRVGERRLPGISRVLFRILETAHVNRFEHGKRPDAADHANRAWRDSRRLTLCHDGPHSVALSEMLVTTAANGYGEGVGRISALKERIANYDGTWPKGSRPHGFMVGIVTDFAFEEERDRYLLRIAGWEAPQYVETRPHVFAEGTNCIRSPYIGIVSYALPTRGARTPFGLRAYLQPCLAEDSWFPIDSDYERATVWAMLEWRNGLPEGWLVDIRKPLFDELVDMPDSSKVACRADFVLTVKHGGNYVRRVAVETMGFDTEEYMARKRRTHPAMVRKWRLLVQHNMMHRRQANIELAKRNFLDELTEAALRGKQPLYNSVGGHTEAPIAPR